MESREAETSLLERRPKIRRLSRKMFPDTIDTDSCPEVDPGVFQLELKNKALQKQNPGAGKDASKGTGRG